MNNLGRRLEKLEAQQGGNSRGGAFYMHWIEPGGDPAVALAELHRSGLIPADMAAHCAAWESDTPWHRDIGSRPRSRLVTADTLSAAETHVLFYDPRLAKAEAGADADRRDNQADSTLADWTDAELIAALITGRQLEVR